ncbi:MAG: TPR domain protein [Bacteroidetes bacterium]|nr:MAG: TPR domain protein [Bacteroidota bacterium]
MRMRKYFIMATLVSAFVAETGVAQTKADRTTAYMALGTYNREKDPASLAKAKTSIDKACLPESSVKDEPQTWVYRGEIYTAVFQKEFSDQLALVKDVTDPGKKQLTAYGNMNPVNVIEATAAFLKGYNLDSKKVYTDKIMPGIRDCNYALQNIGVSNYNQKKYLEALAPFEKAIESLVVYGNKVDTGLYVNTANCALYGKDFNKALIYYSKLADFKYGKGHTYYQIAQIHKGLNDETKAKEAINKGLELYPSDSELLVEVVNDLIKQGKMSDAVTKLNTIISARPEDGDLRLVVGQVYSRMANPNDAEGKPTAKPKNFEELIAKSEEQLLKAAQLKPAAFEPHYELSYLYYNQGVEYYNRSNSTIADAAKYSTMWEAPIKKGIEWLEKANKINPKDRDVLNMLKISYGQIGDTDNYNRIKELLKKG